jgi:hypothetical protein
MTEGFVKAPLWIEMDTVGAADVSLLPQLIPYNGERGLMLHYFILVVYMI